MVIQHNLLAMYGNRMLGISTGRTKKSMEKLSSGYKINCAGDNAAGTAISEKMRGQIRGLNRVDDNISEAINYISTADGALNEITGMVHRMRELTVQALNDTNTDDDKQQIQLEISQLQREISRMADQTEYNTKDVFDRHEPVYDSIIGNQSWNMELPHTVEKPNNTLVVKLSSEYDPSEVIAEVPEGTYTSYELIETIEELLEEKAPEGTMFLMEYEEGGTCALTLEGGIGLESVEGGLSYLFYASYGGAGVGDLIGTTQFAEGFPLKIATGKNDKLTFSVDKLDGSIPEQIDITLDPGEYSREQVVAALNQKLEDGGHTGVQAVLYGDNNVKLTAGASLITGLKGNMFQIDNTSDSYSSVFYDNAKYGDVIQTAGKITGRAFYNSNCDKIIIDNSNNKIRFKLDGDADYTELSITNKADGYTITELVKELNNQLNATGADTKWKFTSTNSRISSSTSLVPTTDYYDYLTLTSLVEGPESKIVVDTTDAVSNAAYVSLFQKTTITTRTSPSCYWGSDTYLRGARDLSGSIILGSSNEKLNISAGGINAEITLSKSSYTNFDELLAELNTKISSSALAGKIRAQKYDTKLELVPTDDTVTSITASGTAYKDLFESTGPQYKSYYSDIQYGTTSAKDGTTVVTKTPAILTFQYPMTTDNITIDKDNNKLELAVNGVSKSITLTNGNYTRKQLVEEVNKQFTDNNIGVTAKLNASNCMVFSTKLAGAESSLYISTYSSNPATRALMTPSIGTYSASSSSKKAAYIQGKTKITSDFVIDDTNCKFAFCYPYNPDNGSLTNSHTITLKKDTYATPNDLVNQLQSKLNTALSGEKITVSLDSYSRIILTAKEGGRANCITTASCDGVDGGGFYQKVLYQNNVQTKTNTAVNTAGTVSANGQDISKANVSIAYVVGRADLKNNTVEIKQGVNDVLKLDLTYPKADGTSATITLESTLSKGKYTGNEIVDMLKTGLNHELQNTWGITNLIIEPEIGNINTGVVGANDANALNFKLKWAPNTDAPEEGAYKLDGVSGSAAYTVFYKTSGLPKPASLTGSKDITAGVEITDQNNTFGFTVDGVDYDFTIPEGTYTAEDFAAMLTGLFAAGDDNGNIPKVEAYIENGNLKIQYATFGAHEITGIRGTAKDDIFFAGEERAYEGPMRIQIGANAGQELALNKIPISTSLLKIDTILVTKHSYGQFALKHLDYALNYINHQRSVYGARMNRLEHAGQLTENAEENLQAAESKLRDTDMGDETVKLAKETILSQASVAMLTQANGMYSDGVLKLLS